MDYQLVIQLQSIMNSSDDSDTNKNIADYILHHMSVMKSITINELSANCFTSSASISRFARTVGCDNFSELKHRLCESSVQYTERDLLPERLLNLKYNNDATNKAILEDYEMGIHEALVTMSQTINLSKIDSLVNLIQQNQNIYLFGIQFPGMIIQFAQTLFMYMNKFVNYFDVPSNQKKFAEKIPNGSLAIFFSLNGNYFHARKELVETLRKQNCYIVLITQNEQLNKQGFFNDVIYLGKSDSNYITRYKLMMFIDLLINRYAEKAIKIK